MAEVGNKLIVSFRRNPETEAEIKKRKRKNGRKEMVEEEVSWKSITSV